MLLGYHCLFWWNVYWEALLGGRLNDILAASVDNYSLIACADFNTGSRLSRSCHCAPSRSGLAFCIFNDICMVQINTVRPPSSKCPLSVLQNVAHLCFAVLPWTLTCQHPGHHPLLSGSAELRLGEHHPAGEASAAKLRTANTCDQQSLTPSWQLKLQGSVLRFWRNSDFLKKHILGQFCHCSDMCWKWLCWCLTQKAELFVAGKVALHHLSPFTKIPTGIWQVLFLISVISSPLCQVKRQTMDWTRKPPAVS